MSSPPWIMKYEAKLKAEEERARGEIGKAEEEGKPWLKETSESALETVGLRRKNFYKQIKECPPYQPGDIITFGGFEIHGMWFPERTVVVKGVHTPLEVPTGRLAFTYDIRQLRDDRKGVLPETLALSADDINQGKCRPETIERFEGPLKAVEVAVRRRKPPTFAPPPPPKDEFAEFKRIVDTLLADLPRAKIDEFATSPEFKVYSKVMEDGQPEDVRAQFVEITDMLLGELPQTTIEKFVATPDFQVYQRVIERFKKE